MCVRVFVFSGGKGTQTTKINHNHKPHHQYIYQDARTPFYVLARGGEQAAGPASSIDDTTASSGGLPQVFFIEASANAAAAHQVC